MYRFFALLLLPFTAYAFNVDSMVKYQNKEDFFILTGDKKDSREYIYTTISELKAVKGKSVEDDLSLSNVASWPVIAEPSEIILGEGDQVRVKIEKNFEATDEDRIFGITFTPDLIGQKGQKKYNIGFGYKVWMIVPGNAPLKGDVFVEKSSVSGSYIIKNSTNKVLEVDINYCGNERESNSCRGQLFIRPGVDKKVELGVKTKKAEFSFYAGGDKNKMLKKIDL
ncbi:hypothetical protein B9P82_23825 [Citrobacter sp. L55]|uniref:hypothetical protein n=1 Tax=Citrobacter sp. L55 TaxID=1981983 RepID=UPI000C78CB27|nr:hypothetical protein [Citrobacter sp. L55]PLC60646.1 hypothetical protein B9P82_23825 [Citrobacter sp. L55]